MQPADLLLVIQWAGAMVGLAGAALLALNTKISRWGWIAFLASNLLILVFTAETGAWGLFTMQIGFTATSALGIWRAFYRPAPVACGQLTPEIVSAWLDARGLVAMPARAL